MEARETNVAPEVVVATMPEPEAVVTAGEEKIKGEIAMIGAACTDIKIACDAQYEQAAEMGREIKRKGKMVKDLFAPIKEAANKAHKAACEREKMMLSPLLEAEKAIKAEMSRYTMEKEAERRRIEEEARRRAAEESARLLEQAVAHSEQGDEGAAARALDDAQIMSETPVIAQTVLPKAKGVSTRKDFEIVITDLSKVPVEIMGAMLRPVDQAAVMKLVRATGGKIQIPGIVVKEVTKTVLRS